MPHGPVMTHDFRVTNTTGEPLHIADVRASCGCVSGSATRTDLGPGESTTIVTRMETSRFSGLAKKVIYVEFDRPRPAEVQLTVGERPAA